VPACRLWTTKKPVSQFLKISDGNVRTGALLPACDDTNASGYQEGLPSPATAPMVYNERRHLNVFRRLTLLDA
jgi:hypothetical protein